MKKILKVSSILLLVIAMYINIGLLSNTEKDLNLKDLIVLNEASAETGDSFYCWDVENPNGYGWFNHRVCEGCCWDMVNYHFFDGTCSTPH